MRKYGEMMSYTRGFQLHMSGFLGSKGLKGVARKWREFHTMAGEAMVPLHEAMGMQRTSWKSVRTMTRNWGSFLGLVVLFATQSCSEQS